MINIIITILYAMLMGCGQIVLSFAAKDLFPVQGFSIKAALSSPWLWFGIFIYAVAIFIWIYILSRFNVKYAYPISSTAIFFAAFYQSMIDKTFPSGSYWLGLVIVIIGLTILSLHKV
jgi:undecaprenyl phosphate-alpha-L-ara4N flippase subunit ArnE